MANKNKGQGQAQPKPPVAPAPKASETPNPSPAIDVLGATDAKAGEGASIPASSPPPPAAPSEQAPSYKAHQALWDSKKDKAARASDAEQTKYIEPDKKIPGKYRKFQNLKEKK